MADDPKKKKDEAPPEVPDVDGAAEGAEVAEAPDATPVAPAPLDSPTEANPMQQEINEAAQALAGMDPPILVDASHSPSDFLKHLCTALLNHKSMSAADKADDAAETNKPEQPQMPKEETPMVAMSTAQAARMAALEAENKTARAKLLSLSAKAADSEFRNLNGEIETLARDGYITVAKKDGWLKTLSAKKLSLADQTPEASAKEVLDRLQMTRELIAEGAILKGHYWTPEQKTVQLSLASEEQQPEHARHTATGDVTPEEVARIQAERDKLLKRTRAS